MIKCYKAPWGKLLIWVSALATLLCVSVTIGMLLKLGFTYGLPMIPMLLVLVSALFTVRGYSIIHDEILIQRLFWTTRLPLAGLKSARFEPNAMNSSIRTFGNGGLFSFTGFYYSKALGSYRAFVTDLNSTVVLKIGERTVVLSPETPDEFVAQLSKAAAN